MVYIGQIQKIFLFISCIWGFHFLIHAQNRPSDIKIKLAESYERAGDLETAVKLYKEAYSKDSNNYFIFDALKRNYLQLKRYDNAIILMQLRLRKTPNDIGLLAQLGTIYILKSDESNAFKIWEQAIIIDPKNEITYRIVGSAMVQGRLFDKTIELYKRGRTACNNPTLFTSDIAYMYSVMLNYADATREYLNMLRQNPTQIGFVQSSISSYTGRADGLSAATSNVEDVVKTEIDNVSFHRLLAWLYMEGKRFDNAYSVYKFIDEKMSAGGRELFNFGEQAFREKAFSAAKRAYQDIMSKHPKFEQLAMAKFGYARSLEEADELSDTLKLFDLRNPFPSNTNSESQSPYVSAVEAYQRVEAEYPNTEIAARSLHRIALIKRDKFLDLDGARSALEAIEKSYARFASVTMESKLCLGDVYLAAGNLSQAEARYKSLTEISYTVNQQKETAALRLAELDYFNQKFEDALKKLGALTNNPISDVANDAIGLKIFIQENLQPTDAALKEFARADLLKRQHKLTDALVIFESLVKKFPKTDIVDEALISIGDLLTQMGRYVDAVASYGRMATDYPESIFLDRTLMKMGQVYQLGIKDKDKAIETYQQLLEKYPSSIFVNEVRRRIRELRGDNI